jgi:ATP-dependent RNA helicase DeaD
LESVYDKNRRRYMKFEDFNFKPKLSNAIRSAGFKEPSPVQKEAIPIVLEGSDLVAQAHTGTGKTAAFGLPILNMMECKGEVEAVVIVPTRELATQVSDELFRFGRNLGVNTATVYGGSSYKRQIAHIQKAGIVVATPGRLLDLLKKGLVEINPTQVVLDEADEMLDMGFLDDIKEIFTYFPSSRQTLMFSATMPPLIKDLAKTILHEPKFVTITKSDTTNKNIKQFYYVVHERERDDALIRLLDVKNPHKCIVFCRTKKEVDRLSSFLSAQGYGAKGLHGDMEQREREEVIKGFKRGKLEILIATDVAARGLDVSDVTHVFNYHIPFDSESYVHRIGRTGRAGREGEAISIVTPHEFNALKKIQKDVGSTLESRVIPSGVDMAMKKRDAVLDELKSVRESDIAIEMVEELKKELSYEEIALKMATLLFRENDIEGSDKIGMSSSEVEALFEEHERELKRKNSQKRGNRRRGRSKPNSRRRDARDKKRR